jgi:hypothetical protein
VLGTILITQNRVNIEDSLAKFGISKDRADEIAQSLSQSGGGDRGGFGRRSGAEARKVFDAVQLDFAQASQVVFYVMAGALAVAALVALVGLRTGRQEQLVE